VGYACGEGGEVATKGRTKVKKNIEQKKKVLGVGITGGGGREIWFRV